MKVTLQHTAKKEDIHLTVLCPLENKAFQTSASIDAAPLLHPSQRPDKEPVNRS